MALLLITCFMSSFVLTWLPVSGMITHPDKLVYQKVIDGHRKLEATAESTVKSAQEDSPYRLLFELIGTEEGGEECEDDKVQLLPYALIAIQYLLNTPLNTDNDFQQYETRLPFNITEPCYIRYCSLKIPS